MRTAKTAKTNDAATSNLIPAGATHVATLGGESRYMNAANMMVIMDALVAAYPNAGVPKVEAISDLAALAPTYAAPVVPEAKPESERRPVVAPAALPVSGAKPVSDFGATVVDDEAKVRIEGQRAVLASRGIAVDAGQQLFATGTRMAVSGYETQEARRVEHEAKLSLVDVANALVSRVESEKRVDVEVSAKDFANAIGVNGTVTVFGKRLREQAIRGLLGGRLESPALSYVLAMRDRIAENVRLSWGLDANADGAAEKRAAFRAEIEADKAKIADVLRYECLRNPDAKLKLRTREAVGDVFSVVSTSYSVADAPQALAKLLDGLPRDAKGSYAYDPVTTTWELRASVWTPTPVAEQAVGEAFEGYASFWSKDDGTGSFRGGGGAIFLRCLNASTFSANSTDVRRRHVGDVLGDVKELLASSLAAVDALCEAWGLARKDEIRLEGDLYAGMPMSQILSGLFYAELRNPKSDLAGVLPGRSSEHAKNLASVYASERRDPAKLVRSDFGQAWTRYVQDQSASVRREAEGAVGSWLLDPRPMKYEALRA